MREYLIDHDLKFSSDWTVYKNQIVTFRNLHDRKLPLARIIERGTVTELSTEEFHGIDENYRRVFKNLLRLCLQQFLRSYNVYWQHRIGLFYFGSVTEGQENRPEKWAGKKTATRVVVKRIPRRDEPSETYCYRHLAFRVAFHVYDATWYASIKPEWYFSSDGRNPFIWGPKSVGWMKRRERNMTVFGHLRFISDYLRRQSDPDIFRQNSDNPFITFGDLKKLRGLHELNDSAWKSREGKSAQKKLEDQDGIILFEPK